MARTGAAGMGVLRLQLAPAHPDGNVGGPVGATAAMVAVERLPFKNVCGSRLPSTTAARITTSDQRQRSDITPE
jgi:hypothetical protein